MSHPTQPKLSILLISYNHVRFIEQCLAGVFIQQTPFAFELVVADDSSNDGTAALIEATLAGHDLDWRLLPATGNLGMHQNYRRGFDACRGEYVAVLEGDDYWTCSNMLARHVAFLDAHHEVVMSFTKPVRLIDESRRFIPPRNELKTEFEYVTTAVMATGNRIGNLSTCVFRQSAVRRLDQRFWSIGAADWGFGMALGQFGLLARLKGSMSVYRVHADGKWSGATAGEQVERVLRDIDKWDEYFGHRYSKEFAEHRRRLTGRDRESWFKMLLSRLRDRRLNT